MAIFISTGAMAHISGRQGGQIFYQRRCSSQVLPVPRRIVRIPTPAQYARRIAFARCKSWLLWNRNWEIIIAWQQWAGARPRTNRKGLVYYMTYQQAFMSINIIRLINGLEIQPYPPGYPY